MAEPTPADLSPPIETAAVPAPVEEILVPADVDLEVPTSPRVRVAPVKLPAIPGIGPSRRTVPPRSVADTESRWEGETSRLGLDASLPLRAGLRRAMAQVLGFASAVAQGGDRDPVKAVHEFRKAVRRGRALLRLCHGLLAGRDRKALSALLRSAAGATSELRDDDVFASALDDIIRCTGGDEARWAPIRALISGERKQHLAGTAPAEILRKHAPSLSTVTLQFGAALDDDLEWRALRQGLESTMRAAKQSYEEAVASREESHIHAWRKRTKEVRYQLELFASTGNLDAAEARANFAELAQQLGRLTDLIALRAYVDRAMRDGRLAQGKPLAKLLRQEVRNSFKTIARDARSAFSIKPRSFAKKMSAAVVPTNVAARAKSGSPDGQAVE